MPSFIPVPIISIGLLLCSNIFMTCAWYGHLKFPMTALWRVILISWGIAFFEYCLQVPANRYGYGHFTAAELKTIQEVLSLGVFMVFSVFYLEEPIRCNYVLGFAMIVGAAFVIFRKPHIHAEYSGDEVVVALDGEVLEGEIPKAKMKLLDAWMVIHHDDLAANWELLSKGEQYFRIDPLK